MVDVTRRWLGEQERHVSFCFGSLPERHVTLEVACKPSVVGSLDVPMITDHASHQVGLDADIWLSPMPTRKLSHLEADDSAISRFRRRTPRGPLLPGVGVPVDEALRLFRCAGDFG